MKILVPITSSKDIELLNPKIYGTEFFCGYLPEWWIEKYNDSQVKNGMLSTPINNRNDRNANVRSFVELKEIVKKADHYSTDVFLVLNAKYYPDYIYKNMKRYIDEVLATGIKRMIVSDNGMIHYLNENYPEIKVSVSCLNQITNTMAAKFYSSFDTVDRIVFPRHMSAEEIEDIVRACPDTEFEYFIFSNKCLYDDGYCRGVHEFTPICKDLYYSDFYAKDGRIIEYKKYIELRTKEHEYSDWTRNELMVEKNNYCTANFACSACSLLKLMQYRNVVSVKISIRGHAIEERVRQVQMAHEVIKAIEHGASKERVQQLVCELYGKENLCETGMSCMMV